MAAFASLILLAGGTVSITDDPRPTAVMVDRTGRSDLVTGSAGKALYTYDGDAGLNQDCIEACLEAWPPLLAEKGSVAVGDWAPRVRPGGALQWAYKGDLVYYYSGDRDGTTAAGDGLGGVWHALRFIGPTPRVLVPAAARVVKAGAKFRLTDPNGLTLYTFDRDGRVPACAAQCLEVWPPLLAPAMAGAVGRWSPIDRPDGIRQWAFGGRLVYRFSDDLLPGDANGAGGVWTPIEVTIRDAGQSNTTRRKETRR